jgi:hypothetical protein
MDVQWRRGRNPRASLAALRRVMSLRPHGAAGIDVGGARIEALEGLGAGGRSPRRQWPAHGGSLTIWAGMATEAMGNAATSVGAEMER